MVEFFLIYSWLSDSIYYNLFFMQQIPKIDPSHGIQIPYNEPQRLIEEIIQKS